MINGSHFVRVEKIEQPADRYVPYATLELLTPLGDGRNAVGGGIVMPANSIKILMGRDPVVGDEFYIQLTAK